MWEVKFHHFHYYSQTQIIKFCFHFFFACQGDVINLGNRQLTVLHMPGHSRGSICLHDHENKLLFTGDVVYDGHMIDWLPYSHVSDYISSCERLVGLVDSEQVIVIVGVASSYLMYKKKRNHLLFQSSSASDIIGVPKTCKCRIFVFLCCCFTG